MSQEDEPARLLASGGNDMERRLIGAIAQERPSPELRQRMAQVIGVPLGTLATAMALEAVKEAAEDAATVATEDAMPAVSAPAGAAEPTGSGSLASLSLASICVLTLAVAGGLAVVHPWRKSSLPTSPPPSAALAGRSEPPFVAAAPSPAAVRVAPAPTGASPPLTPSAPTGQRGRTPALTADLREQIALIDGARAAAEALANERALDLLRQYQQKYPAGTFRPEAAALRIETLVRLGRTAEARGLATRFQAEYGENPQTDRVRRLVGVPGP